MPFDSKIIFEIEYAKKSKCKCKCSTLNKEAKIIIAKIWCMKLAKVYISGWRNFTVKQLDTRKYFESLERGEIHEEKFNKLLGNKDADVIYNLPRKIAIKIFSYLNIEDLSKCREVRVQKTLFLCFENVLKFFI